MYATHSTHGTNMIAHNSLQTVEDPILEWHVCNSDTLHVVQI
jgi:hypothetical protein